MPNIGYYICNANAGGSTVAVGSKLPNNWGIYDTAGNVYEWVRDIYVSGDMKNRTDAFTAATGSNTNRRIRGGCSYNNGSSNSDLRSGFRHYRPYDNVSQDQGFRVSMIVKE